MDTTPNNSAPPKRGRGRPEGSNSFCFVTLEAITKHFGANGSANIMVSKKWLQTIGMIGHATEATAQVMFEKVAEKPQPVIDFKIQSLDE